MKKIFQIIGIIFFLFNLTTKSFAETSIETLSPTDDISSRTAYSPNGGSGYYCETPELRYSKYNHVFMKFDLSSIKTTVKNAKLRLYFFKHARSETIYIRNAKTDNWNECSKSATGSTLMASGARYAIGWYDYDVTSFVNTEASGDGLITFDISSSHGNYGYLYSRQACTAYYSSNWTRNGYKKACSPPELVVEYNIPKSAPVQKKIFLDMM